MKMKILVLIIAVLALASCVAKENDSTSGSFLVINSLTGNDLDGKAGSTTVFSDVSTASSIINDNGVASMSTRRPIIPWRIRGSRSSPSTWTSSSTRSTSSSCAPTASNVEGVDVPYRFTQPMNMLVPVDGTVPKIPFVLIRHVAKLEAPLLALREVPSHEFVLQLVAKVTVHGKDLGGHRVAPVSGYMTVWCANFADPVGTTHRPTMILEVTNMKKILFHSDHGEPGTGPFVLQALRGRRPDLGRPGRLLHPGGRLGHARPAAASTAASTQHDLRAGDRRQGQSHRQPHGLPGAVARPHVTHQQIDWGYFDEQYRHHPAEHRRQRRGQRLLLLADRVSIPGIC